MNKHQPRKRFGQNFLHDPSVIARIIALIDPKPQQIMVEIGPGLGALTKHLLPLVQRLHVVELDRDVIQPLQQTCLGLGELLVQQGDALTFDFRQLVNAGQKMRVVGNLPYNISTPLLFHLIEQIDAIADMHFMLQKEVVERMAANVGTKAYGRLSVMIQYFCHVIPLFNVAPAAFNPRPKVESTVVRLIPHQTLPHTVRDIAQLSEVVKMAFGLRRKTLTNSLKGLCQSSELMALNIDPQQRAEQLTLTDFVKIANYLSK